MTSVRLTESKYANAKDLAEFRIEIRDVASLLSSESVSPVSEAVVCVVQGGKGRAPFPFSFGAYS